MALKSRRECIKELVNMLVARALIRGIQTTDTHHFADEVKRNIEAVGFKHMGHSCGGGEEAQKWVDGRVAEANKDLTTQLTYLLDIAGKDYGYRATCLADDIDDKAPHKLNAGQP